MSFGNSLAVQWLGLGAFTAATRRDQKKKKRAYESLIRSHMVIFAFVLFPLP